MENLILTIKDKSKLNFLIELLSQFDFVEIKDNVIKKKKQEKTKKDDFFALAGIWKDRNITAKELREAAWKIKK